MDKKDLNNRLFPLVFSLAIHVVLLLSLPFLWDLFFKTFRYEPFTLPQAKVYILEKPIQDKKLDLRTVGKKDGKKNFSMPIGENKSPDKVQGQIGLQDLTPTPKESEKIKPIMKKEAQLDPKKGIKLAEKQKQIQMERKERWKKLEHDVLKEMHQSSHNSNALKAKGFNFDFEPPEGVSEDELNSLEKVFYSFQKRTYETYLRSFVSTYYRMLQERPRIKDPLQNGRHKLSARVVFDRLGNIISIKILNSSYDDDIHDLFEDTLKAMKSLPNPPKDLLDSRGEFTIYYRLDINS